MHPQNADTFCRPKRLYTMPRSIQTTNLLNRLPARVAVVLRVVGRLADAQGMKVYLVGGVVRDLLLHRPTFDLDLAVEGDGIAMARLVSGRFRTSLTVFDRFATARLQFPSGLRMDIATMRKESYALPAELPEVEPASLAEDLYRRDFTINAMAIQLNAGQVGQLIDCHGGQKDLRNRTIRVLHEKSFEDDPTRTFRAVRFEQRFKGRLEANTQRLLRAAAATDLIDRLSGPRLCNEWFLLFAERDPSRAMDRLSQLNLFRSLHPQLRYNVHTRRMIRALSKALAWWTRRFPISRLDRSVLYLMALLEGVSESVLEGVITRLMLSNEQARKVRSSGTMPTGILRMLGGAKSLRPSEVYHLLIELPDEALVLLLAKGLAGKKTVQMGRTQKRISRFMTRLRGSKTALRGADLLQMEMEPGPQIKELLTQLLDARLDGIVRTRAQERAFLQARLTAPLSSSE
jgi:tRNA nucleotidyltransferase (CCA-adding enzyme)